MTQPSPNHPDSESNAPIDQPGMSPEEMAERDRVLKGSNIVQQVKGPLIFLGILMAVVMGYQFFKPRGEPVAGNVKSALTEASQSGKPIIMAFTDPPHCPPCVVMERRTWPDEKLQAYIKDHYILVKLNPYDPQNKEWMMKFGVKVFPTTAITSSSGELIRRHDQMMDAQEMLSFLENTYEHAKSRSAVTAAPTTQEANLPEKYE